MVCAGIRSCSGARWSRAASGCCAKTTCTAGSAPRRTASLRPSPRRVLYVPAMRTWGQTREHLLGLHGTSWQSCVAVSCTSFSLFQTSLQRCACCKPAVTDFASLDLPWCGRQNLSHLMHAVDLPDLKRVPTGSCVRQDKHPRFQANVRCCSCGAPWCSRRSRGAGDQVPVQPGPARRRRPAARLPVVLHAAGGQLRYNCAQPAQPPLFCATHGLAHDADSPDSICEGQQP